MKLTYFDGRGKAELIRILLAYGEVPYENVRIKGEDWPSIKGKTPFGVLPILEVDGKVIAETATIVRFAAKKVGLHGSDPLEQALIEMVLDNIDDLSTIFGRVNYPVNEAAMQSDIKTANEVKIPTFVANAEKLLVSRGGKHFVGNKLTVADVAMFYVLSMLTSPTTPSLTKYKGDRLGKARLSCLDNAPTLKGLVKMVGEVPNIKKWIETRPGDDVEQF